MTHSVLGVSLDTGEKVTISQVSRRQSLYLIGNSGTGKSNIIVQLILQDIKQNKGLCAIDPHGSLIEAVLQRCEKRLEDIILLDLTMEQYPFGINVLDHTNQSSMLAMEAIIDQAMDVFSKTYDITRENYHIYEYLFNSIATLVQNNGYTLADIPALLREKDIRHRLLKPVTDTDLLAFWRDYDRMKPQEQREAYDSIRNKVNELVRPLTRNILGQSSSTINMRNIMDEGKILLIRLDRQLPLATSMIGSIIISRILNAAFTREDIPEQKRRQFNLYLDEAQRYVTESMAEAFDEARKYGLTVLLAHQRLSQLPLQIQSAARSVRNMLIFKVSGEDAKELVSELELHPSPPPITGERAIRTITQTAVDQLLKGSTSPVVTAFVQAYLAPANDFKLQKTKAILIDAYEEGFVKSLLGIADTHYVKSGEIEEAFGELNRLLYEVMATRNASLPIPLPLLITCGKFCGYKHIMVPYYYGVPWHSYRSSNGYEGRESIEFSRQSREQTWPDLIPLCSSDFESQLPMLCQRLVVNPRINYGRALHEQEFIQLVTFLRHLRAVM
jgi:hypothetical protein